MIRNILSALAMGLLGGIVLFSVAFVVIVFSIPHAKAGETCNGTIGLASYYGAESGNTTANGEHFQPEGFTVASRGLPFNTRLRITMLDPRPQMRQWYGKSVVVRVNDRGPFIKGRFLDLSHGAARVIGLTQSGVSKVCAEKL